MRRYFGTDGVRGVVGQYPITPDFALKLGYSLGKVLGQSHANTTVVIGKDTRISGYLFESSLEAGFCYAGVNVIMVGPLPTPAIAYLTTKLKLSAGIVISASHNPYTDNGIKIFGADGAKLGDDLELAIESELDQPMIKAPHLGKVMRLSDALEQYVEFCCSTCINGSTSLSNLKIVVDCANGATYQAAPLVFTRLGAEVLKVACEPDGLNINKGCGSTHPDFLVAEVLKHNADLGIAFDGDGDRVIFVDHKGTVYDGDKLTYIIFKAYQRLGHPALGVVGTVMTNLAMELALKSHGFELVRAKVGDRYVVEELRKRSWEVGGESSGHILCLDKHTTGDGIISALQVLSMLVEKPLAECIDWQEFPQVMINVKVERDDNWQVNAAEIINMAQNDLGENGRVVVRASGTEPVVRVMVEAKNIEKANLWSQKIASAIRERDALLQV